MASDKYCGSSLLASLPEDALGIVTQSLSPEDICNLGACCRSLYGLASSDDIWNIHCEKIGILLQKDLVDWRKGFASYKALFRFLSSVHPLIGIWVHQNPELGNVVYVMPGFLSVVGCRIIPQKLGPLGMEGGPIQWAPVFEIIGEFDGSAVFFLHGREGDVDYLYPASFKPGNKTCNVLTLEVEPRRQSNGGKLVHSKSFDHRLGTQEKDNYRPSVPFSRLEFDDRSELLDTVTRQIRFRVPDSTSGLFFPCLRSNEDNFLKISHLYKQGGVFCNSLNGDGGGEQLPKGTSLVGYLASLKQILWGSSSMNNGSSSDCEQPGLDEFLRSGDAIGLTVDASTVEFSFYKAWPYMSDKHFALYKMPVQAPKMGQEHAGLWGATFGWPPGIPGKALYFLLLSYEESEGKQLLIATKILEGSNYVRHPNGSAMFIVNIDEVSLQPFPWDADVLHAFAGEGITRGYGFRYTSSMPGSLYVIQDGLLAFVWKRSEAVVTLQRLNLTELLKKGEKIPSLSPVLNFSYLTRDYTNVFSNTST